MIVRFWGVRGSIASPGPETSEVGGNTSAVEVVCGSTRLCLDAGTGLRALGQSMLRARSSGERLDLTLLLSHYHWDHIQGLPFYAPLYAEEAGLTVIGGSSGIMGVREALEHQMKPPVFPVRFDDVGARIVTREALPGRAFDVGEATVRTARGNHPGGVVAYRIEHEGVSVVYATDTEHDGTVDPSLRALAEGADVLIYDAQYTPEEYPRKRGWGHSTYLEGIALAHAAGVRDLILFHHDPTRSDRAVAAVEREARALFPRTQAAREGLCLELDRRGLVLHAAPPAA